MSFDEGQLQRISERARGAGVNLVTAEPADLAAAEVELGIALPASLRQLYLQVGDGGFGPGLHVPIQGYPSGVLYSLSRLVEVHRSNQQVLEDDPYSPWPSDVVQFADLGGFSSVAVECRGTAHPVLEYESDVDEVAPDDAWTLVAPTVEDWFADWVDDRDPPAREKWAGRHDGL